jgi:MoaA/NifB/PqqE/SkfB family radical SAM enzyme
MGAANRKKIGRALDWVKERARGRPFEAFQIEVTSRCTLRCRMCPKTALADCWSGLDLPWVAFQRLASFFGQTKHVHLQGWGEPFLHPRLFDMIAEAKSAGCRVGLTTNGVLLTLEAGRRLLHLHLDLLAVSIAGATQGTHAGIRVGSHLPTILENVRRFLDLRDQQKDRTPKVEIFFLMTRTNLSELPLAVDLAASLRVDELVATNLDYVLTPEHDDLKAFGHPSLRDAFVRILDEARERAQRIGLAFRSYPLDREEVAVCEANPTKILFISCDGSVSPCTYMGLVGRSDIPRRFDGQTMTVPRLQFGNVLDQGLLEIWGSPAYRNFRRQFAGRRLGVAARALATLGNSEPLDSRLPPPPDSCRSCYKLYGL